MAILIILFLAAVVIGAAITVMVATVTGIPILTTHSLTGALVGAGCVAAGLQVWDARIHDTRIGGVTFRDRSCYETSKHPDSIGNTYIMVCNFTHSSRI